MTDFRSRHSTREWYKLISPGMSPDGRVFVEIELHHVNDRTDDRSQPELSITGVVGPKANGDCRGSCGQIVDSMEIRTLSPGWTTEMVDELRRIWNRWHLNALTAGSPAQEAHLRDVKHRFTGGDHYKWALAELAGVGLQPDESMDPPYSYGSAWLYESLPADVLEWLQALPDTTINYPWSRT